MTLEELKKGNVINGQIRTLEAEIEEKRKSIEKIKDAQLAKLIFSSNNYNDFEVPFNRLELIEKIVSIIQSKERQIAELYAQLKSL